MIPSAWQSNWSSYSTNPFASEWERLLAWVRTHPEGSTRELFDELQELFPGRYQPSQYPALQRGVRKMRAYLRDCMVEDPWPIEVIHGPLETTDFPAPIAQEAHVQISFVRGPSASSSRISPKAPKEAPCVPGSSITEKEGATSPETPVDPDEPLAKAPSVVRDQARSIPFSSACEKENRSICVPAMTIEAAIQLFLKEVRGGKRRDKTLDWHQRALRSLQEYLTQQDKCFPQEITMVVVRDWLAQLRATPAERGDLAPGDLDRDTNKRGDQRFPSVRAHLFTRVESHAHAALQSSAKRPLNNRSRLLDHHQIELLCLLATAPVAPRVGELAARLKKSSMTVSTSLMRLQHYGYVSREDDVEDGRTSRIQITEAGREQLDFQSQHIPTTALCTPFQVELLVTLENLGEGGIASVQAFAQLLGCRNSGAVSNNLILLEREGLVRRDHADTLRELRIQITEAGRRQLELLRKNIEEERKGMSCTW